MRELRRHSIDRPRVVAIPSKFRRMEDARLTCAIDLATTRRYGFVTWLRSGVTRWADPHSVGLRRLLHRRMHETATIRVLPARLA
jgi:hypothetical protein